MIRTLDTNKVVVEQIHRANTFWRRLAGLLPYAKLPAGEGMLLSPCRSVHTFFMRFQIDVIYLDALFRVVAIFPAVKPWRTLPLVRQCRHVLEVSAGTINQYGIAIGQGFKID